MTVLFRTIHGSHLYGLATPESDTDWYTVVANKPGRRKATYAKQSIHDGLDSTTIDLSTFRKQCDAGVPQALEALFSQVPEVDLLTDFRASYRIDTAKVTATYRRTMRNFAEDNTFKKRRHVIRLFMNLQDMTNKGRFNPTLCSGDIAIVNEIAEHELAFQYFREAFQI
jgi:predicted nucleotidyltransferase